MGEYSVLPAEGGTGVCPLQVAAIDGRRLGGSGDGTLDTQREHGGLPDADGSGGRADGHGRFSCVGTTTGAQHVLPAADGGNGVSPVQ